MAVRAKALEVCQLGLVAWLHVSNRHVRVMASMHASPAALRYTASSPALLAWMKRWNDGRPYDRQIRPFAFLLAFMPRTGLFAEPDIRTGEPPKRGRPRKAIKLKPIAGESNWQLRRNWPNGLAGTSVYRLKLV
jgi:hypothetical protein